MHSKTMRRMLTTMLWMAAVLAMSGGRAQTAPAEGLFDASCTVLACTLSQPSCRPGLGPVSPVPRVAPTLGGVDRRTENARREGRRVLGRLAALNQEELRRFDTLAAGR